MVQAKKQHILKIIKMFSVTRKLALAGFALWLECWPSDKSVPGFIPGQGHVPQL